MQRLHITDAFISFGRAWPVFRLPYRSARAVSPPTGPPCGANIDPEPAKYLLR